MVGAAWHPVAAYLYVLHLDGPSLAWEYLRRNPEYRRDWRDRWRRGQQAQRWGLRLLTTDGPVDAWGAPARSAFARRRARRHADGRPPTIPEELASTRATGPVRHRSDAGLVADVVDLRRRALPATPPGHAARVTRRTNVREVALLVGSLTLLVVALTT